MLHTYRLSYSGGIGRKITVLGQPKQNQETLSEKQTKNGKELGVWLKR
jgi:hypothetical protein